MCKGALGKKTAQCQDDVDHLKRGQIAAAVHYLVLVLLVEFPGGDG